MASAWSRLYEGSVLNQSVSRSIFYEGIDLLRSGAVFLVLWSHAGPVLPASLQAALAAPWFRPGFWGVTIFFAISGFLVVGQLIDIATGQRAESLRTFVLRRWIRTVPTYWIALLLLLLSGAIGWQGWGNLFINAFFLQGSISGEPILLPVSWSLVIEEWSYLLCALAAMALIFCRDFFHLSNKSVMKWIGVMLFFQVFIASFERLFFIENDVIVRELKQGLLLQLDALAYGGALAWLMRMWPQRFESIRLQSSVVKFGVLTAISLLSVSAGSLFRKVLEPVPVGLAGWFSFGFYPLAGVLAAALILSFWDFKYKSLPLILSRMVRVLSRASYSIYLLHVPFAHIVSGIEIPGILKFLIYIFGSVFIGDICWRIIEVPFMRLRRKLV